MMECSGELLDPDQIGREAQSLEADLRRLIVGQDEAIEQVIRVYQTYLAGMSGPGRPIANLFFLGPTGSGKTRLVEAVAESLVGTPRAIIKVNCGEFQHSHEISKLIGSPPGYLGHRETHPLLTQEVLNQYHTDNVRVSFVLFDEIEKASDTLWNLLLGILDKATLTLGDNRRVDFSQALIFMTSNVGASEMSQMLYPRMGFASSEIEQNHRNGIVDHLLTDKLTRAGVEAASRTFSPEFMNRLDKIVVFRPLDAMDLRRVLTIELNAVQERIFSSPELSPFAIIVTDPAREFLLCEGTNLQYGARHLKRAIEHFLVHPLSNLIATRQVSTGDVIRIDFNGTPGRLMFFKDASRDTAGAAPRKTPLAGNAAAGHMESEATHEPLGWLRAKSTKR